MNDILVLLLVFSGLFNFIYDVEKKKISGLGTHNFNFEVFFSLTFNYKKRYTLINEYIFSRSNLIHYANKTQ